MMKTRSKIFALAVFTAVIGAAAIVGQAQTKVGGYRKIAVSDAAVVNAAKFAARSKAETDGAEISLQSIETAEKQQVAGTNYKLCLEVLRLIDGDDSGTRQFVQTVFFVNLKKHLTLKNWEEIESCKSDEK